MVDLKPQNTSLLFDWAEISTMIAVSEETLQQSDHQLFSQYDCCSRGYVPMPVTRVP